MGHLVSLTLILDVYEAGESLFKGGRIETDALFVDFEGGGLVVLADYKADCVACVGAVHKIWQLANKIKLTKGKSAV